MWDRIEGMLRSANGESPRFPPTVLYNENWMLRLVMGWLVDRHASSLIPVGQEVTWYSEALLPSAFLARSRGDSLSESYTHADGVIGHFRIGGNGKADIVLSDRAEQLSVIEGKMSSPLSPGVSNAKYFDQAARNVACIAEVLRLAGRRPADVTHLTFHVMAPGHQIKSGHFRDLVTKESIGQKVRRRVAEYAGERDQWHEEWFLPTLEHVEVGIVSWEEILNDVMAEDAECGRRFGEFYASCLRFN